MNLLVDSWSDSCQDSTCWLTTPHHAHDENTQQTNRHPHHTESKEAKGLTMLTEFGKTLRMMRIAHGNKTLGDLGEMLGVSATFVSAIETGKKSVPPSFINQLQAKLDLDADEVRRLEVAAAKQAKEISMGLHDRTDRARELAVAFARRFENMSDAEVEKVFNQLDDL